LEREEKTIYMGQVCIIWRGWFGWWIPRRQTWMS